MEKQKKKIIKKLKSKYRLIIYNDKTFEDVWSLRLSRLNVFAIIGGGTLLLIILVTVLIAYTSIREFIPGYPDGNMRREIVNNAIRLDSLEREITIRDRYFYVLRTIISGGAIEDSIILNNDSITSYDEIEFSVSPEDSLLRKQIEEEGKYNLSLFEERSSQNDFSKMQFFPPVRGMVVNSFNIEENHYGVDIVVSPNEFVSAILDGTVIMSNWTIETGYVIQIQHDNNLISIYKHNAELLKEAGNHIKAGEVIAIVGNSGELTTGPHLHFEMWHNGVAINPEEYIVF